jgi:hypothetical protein
MSTLFLMGKYGEKQMYVRIAGFPRCYNWLVAVISIFPSPGPEVSKTPFGTKTQGGDIFSRNRAFLAQGCTLLRPLPKNYK